MPFTTDSRTATDHVQAALETVCGVLVTLETIRARTSIGDLDSSGANSLVAASIQSLRQTADLLRSAQQENASPLALGFIEGATRRIV